VFRRGLQRCQRIRIVLALQRCESDRIVEVGPERLDLLVELVVGNAGRFLNLLKNLEPVLRVAFRLGELRVFLRVVGFEGKGESKTKIVERADIVRVSLTRLLARVNRLVTVS